MKTEKEKTIKDIIRDSIIHNLFKGKEITKDDLKKIELAVESILNLDGVMIVKMVSQK